MGAYVIEIGENSENSRGDGRSSNSVYSTMQHQEHCVIEYDRRFAGGTCCGKIPLRTGIFIASAIECMGVTINLILAIVAYVKLGEQQKRSEFSEYPETVRDFVFNYVTSHPKITLACSAVGTGLTYLVVGIMLIGLVRWKSRLFVPHMVAQLCAVVALLVPGVLYSIDAASNSMQASNGGDSLKYKALLIFDLVVLEAFLLACAVNIYFLIIVFRYYRFLRQSESADVSHYPRKKPEALPVHNGTGH